MLQDCPAFKDYADVFMAVISISSHGLDDSHCRFLNTSPVK